MIYRLALAATATGFLIQVAAAGAPSAEWVLLPADAKIYMRPEAGAVLAEAPDIKDGGDYDEYTSLHKVRELPDGWSELETAVDALQHCYDGVAGFRVSLFVRSESIAPVIVRTTNLRFTDGSSLSFLPGTPVRPGSERGRQLVVADGLGFSVVLPEGAVARAYKPVRRAPAKLHDGAVTFPSDLETGYDGGRKVEVIEEEYFPIKAKAGKLVLHGRCGDYQLLQRDRGEVSRPGAMASIFGHDSTMGGDRPNSPEHTSLHWSDGSVAGQLSKDRWPRFGRDGCFRHSIGKTELVLCADKAAMGNVRDAIEEAMQKEKSRRD